MPKVTSQDGTVIAYDKRGQGPVLILVLGALNKRGSGKKIAELLTGDFTVITYDRRGKGDSTDTQPYSPEKEVEDLEALIDELGGSAALFGHSSGAILALLTAKKLGSKVTGVALYEAPYNDNHQAQKEFQVYKAELTNFIAADKRDDTIGRFMELVGVSDKQVAAMKKLPMWNGLTAMSHTLAYDTVKLMEQYPKISAQNIKTKALIMYGTSSFAFMADTADKLSKKMPNATLRPVIGQTHEIKADVLAPLLVDFFLI